MQIRDNVLGFQGAAPSGDLPGVVRPPDELFDAGAELYVSAASLGCIEQALGELANATDDVSAAAVVIVHRCERQWRFGYLSAALHGDLAQCIEIDAQRCKIS
jgi:hypothetical protein